MSTEETRKAAQAERDAIKSDTYTNPEDNQKKADEQDTEAGEKETEDAGDEAETEATSDAESSDEKSEDDAEEKEESKEDVKAKKKEERIERKFAKEVTKRKEAEKELAALRAKLEGKKEDGEPLSAEEQERLIDAKAEQKSLEIEFKKTVQRLSDEARREMKLTVEAFNDKGTELREDIGPIPGQMIAALEVLDNGGKVLAHLLNDFDAMEELYALSAPKMAVQLAKLSLQLSAKPAKPISKVPDPGKPLGGNAKKVDTPINDKMPMDEWMRKRNEEVAKARANGKYNLR